MTKASPTDDRLRNVRAWAAARPDMSGSDVMVAAIDELLGLRAAPDAYRQIGVLRPDGEFTTYEGCEGDPVYIRRAVETPALRCTCKHDTSNGAAHADECPVEKACVGRRAVETTTRQTGMLPAQATVAG